MSSNKRNVDPHAPKGNRMQWKKCLHAPDLDVTLWLVRDWHYDNESLAVRRDLQEFLNKALKNAAFSKANAAQIGKWVESFHKADALMEQVGILVQNHFLKDEIDELREQVKEVMERRHV